MTAAALGTDVTLETLDGVEHIDIRPGTQPGQILPLRGRGVAHLRGVGRGDLLLHVDVAVPTKLDAEQEELLRRFAALRGEERADGQFGPGQQGFFSRLRDAFK
jgi:molecular chaperone DnaJ